MTYSTSLNSLFGAAPVPAVIVLVAALVAFCSPLYAPSGTLVASQWNSSTHYRQIAANKTQVETTERSADVSVAQATALTILGALLILGFVLLWVDVAAAGGCKIWHLLSTYGFGLAAAAGLFFAFLTTRLPPHATLESVAALNVVFAAALFVWCTAMCLTVIASHPLRFW